MGIPDIKRAEAIKNIREIRNEQPPLRIAIYALLHFGYSNQQAERLIFDIYHLTSKEYRRVCRIYGIHELTT
jgi:hypothetical protein